MSKMDVTLKADMDKGTFYWVTTVEAASEDEAVIAAEHLFLEEMERAGEWEFSDFEVSAAS